MTIDLTRIAAINDAAPIAELVNAAYRPSPGAAGWTHESELVSGARTTAMMMESEILRPDSVILIGVSRQEIVACVQVQKKHNEAHIGLLAVKPGLQNSGLGKEMLQHAEKLALDRFGAEKLVLAVISNRQELVNFYIRRGYKSTDDCSGYPASAGVGIPMRTDLVVRRYEKTSK